MKRSELLKEWLVELYQLARLQRSLRLGLRAFWLAGVGVLAGWGVHELWGWMPDPRTWLLAGLALGSLPLVGLWAALSRRSQWMWMMDRKLGFQEQVSTAWDVVHNGSSGQITDALVEDVLGILPEVKRRMLRRGWFLERDLLSAMIVLLLGGLVLASSLIRPFDEWIGPAPERIDLPLPQAQRQEPPPQPGEPAQPPPGMSGGSAVQPGAPENSQPAGPGDQPSQIPDTGTGSQGQADALQELGRALSEQAPTFDLGQALEQLDLGRAAEALDALNDRLGELSPETLENLADALQDAADNLPPGDSLADDLQDAADALRDRAAQGENPRDQDAREALDDLASELREQSQALADSQASGSGSGNNQGSGGSPEPLDRLEGEGGSLELPLDETGESGLLNPAPPQQSGEGTAGGSQDSSLMAGDDSNQSLLVPNSFLWKWRDVVSEYFRR